MCANALEAISNLNLINFLSLSLAWCDFYQFWSLNALFINSIWFSFRWRKKKTPTHKKNQFDSRLVFSCSHFYAIDFLFNIEFVELQVHLQNIMQYSLLECHFLLKLKSIHWIRFLLEWNADHWKTKTVWLRWSGVLRFNLIKIE